MANAWQVYGEVDTEQFLSRMPQGNSPVGQKTRETYISVIDFSPNRLGEITKYLQSFSVAKPQFGISVKPYSNYFTALQEIANRGHWAGIGKEVPIEIIVLGEDLRNAKDGFLESLKTQMKNNPIAFKDAVIRYRYSNGSLPGDDFYRILGTNIETMLNNTMEWNKLSQILKEKI